MSRTGARPHHDGTVTKALARIVSGGDTDIVDTVTEKDLLTLEREAQMSLVKTTATLDRLEHMLETGKPLRN